jgi:nitronate monooxygenase
MQWLSRAELVAAVSNAGGLGIISALTFPTVQELQDEIEKTKRLTNKPFAVNITLLPSMRELHHEDYIKASLEAGVRIIETSGRSPEPYMKLLKDAGARVMHKVVTVRHARTAERAGVDAVTVTGFEAAGHPGMEDVTSLVLLPRVVDAVRIPVIAAGGIYDARGFIAALALGAEGILMGTRFMASQECDMHTRIRQRLLEAEETDTLLIERSIANTARVLKTELSQKILEMETKGATLEELLPLIAGQRSKEALTRGDINAGLIYCGQVIGKINEISGVKEIIEGIINKAKLFKKHPGDLWRRHHAQTTGDA